MEPQIRYVRSADGTSIAYYATSEGVRLLLSPNIWNHLPFTRRGEIEDASPLLIHDGFRLSGSPTPAGDAEGRKT